MRLQNPEHGYKFTSNPDDEKDGWVNAPYNLADNTELKVIASPKPASEPKPVTVKVPVALARKKAGRPKKAR